MAAGAKSPCAGALAVDATAASGGPAGAAEQMKAVLDSRRDHSGERCGDHRSCRCGDRREVMKVLFLLCAAFVLTFGALAGAVVLNAIR